MCPLRPVRSPWIPGFILPNDPSSATRPTGRNDCKPRRSSRVRCSAWLGRIMFSTPYPKCDAHDSQRNQCCNVCLRNVTSTKLALDSRANVRILKLRNHAVCPNDGANDDQCCCALAPTAKEIAKHRKNTRNRPEKSKRRFLIGDFGEEGCECSHDVRCRLTSTAQRPAWDPALDCKQRVRNIREAWKRVTHAGSLERMVSRFRSHW